MPRSSEGAVSKVLAFIREYPGGVTSNEVAMALEVPDRTARRYLAKLYTRGDISREVEYAGEPVTFHYRYKAKKATVTKKPPLPPQR